METQHTPGPWTIADEWDGTSVKAGQFYVTHTIQACGFHEPEVDKAVTQANARLIAAAPDLLEALQTLANMAESFADELHAGHPDVVAARAAIAKATGD